MIFPIPKRTFIAGTMIMGATLSLFVALGSMLYSWHFVRTALRAQGRIIQMVKRDSEGGPTYAPVFVFRDKSGGEHTIHSSLASFPPEHQVGDSVMVLYAASDPTDAKIKTFFSLWGLPFVSGLIAAVYFPLGATLWYWPRIWRSIRGDRSASQSP